MPPDRLITWLQDRADRSSVDVVALASVPNPT